jgi:apolipoprotein D and lipocalin family protein
MVNTETVKKLEIDKFLGQWYEIARYPHSFEKDLVGVTATYSMREDGKIKVLNQGYKNTLNGELKTAEGKAKIPDKNDPSKLKVSFFWFFYADYLVMELDSENYQWAVIGSSSPNYLWILSRTPQMEKDLYMDLLQKIEKRGYDTSKLLLVEQNQD